MRINKFIIFTIIYFLIYVLLFFQFDRDFDPLAYVINPNFTTFGYLTLLIRIEFLGLQIIKFFVINVYIDFYIQLKDMIDTRKANYKLILLKNILIFSLIIILPDIFIYEGPFDIISLLIKFITFIILYILQISAKNKLILALAPLLYCGILIFINGVWSSLYHQIDRYHLKQIYGLIKSTNTW